MVGTKERSFIFGDGISAGAAPKRRFVFFLWNFGMLALSAAGICAVSLQLGIGLYSKQIFFDYFRHPEGYDEQAAREYLAEYGDSDIPEGKKVNILAIQLEAFSDFTTLGLDELEYIYADYHALEDESYTGDLITNVFGGGTVNTERCFLTGYTDLKDYRQNTNSYVWYLRQQGYTANGSHPCCRSFYNRFNVNSYLGFEDYLYTEGYYDKYSTSVSFDNVLFHEMLRLFTEDVSSGKPVFSFNVSYQGHGPYSTDHLDWGDPIWEGYVSDYSYYVVNNYLSSIKDTISSLCELKAELETMDEPVVLVVYGDHMPWFGDGNSVYNELGVNLDISTLSGFMNYYSTRYLIWANDAAKELTGSEFTGEGPDISPCYLMGELFSLLGWDGPAYMKSMNDAERMLPVINSDGFYLKDGQVVCSLDGDDLAELERINLVQYYLRKNFLYQEVIS